MRHYPTTTRVAIAKLYLRYRGARQRAAENRRQLGYEHRSTILASGSAAELWNALQAILRDVDDEHHGKRRKADPATLLHITAKIAQMRTRHPSNVIGA